MGKDAMSDERDETTEGAAGEQFAAWAKLLAMVAIVVAIPLGAWLLNRQADERRNRLGDVTPRRSVQLIGRGVECLRRDDLEAALTHFRQAAAADPKSSDAEKLIGVAHFLLQDFSAAAGAFQRSLDLDRDANVQVWRYLALAREGDPHAADALPDDAAVPEAEVVRLYRGKITPEYFRDGVAQAPAKAADDTAAKIAHARAWFHLGEFRLLHKDAAAAREAFAACVATGLDMPEVVVARRELKALSAAPAGEATKPGDTSDARVLYQGEWMTPDALMERRGFVRRGDAWFPREKAGTATVATPGEDAPQGKVNYRGLWVTPEQRDALVAAAERPATGALDAASDDPEEALRARGLVKYGSLWVTEQQMAAIHAREEQISEERRRREAARARVNGTSRFDPGKPVWVLDDFGNLRAWRVMDWGNPIRMTAAEGADGPSMALALAGGTRLNSAVRRTITADLTGRDALTLDVTNTGETPLNAALALETDAYYETRALPVEPGASATLRYDLGADTFKSQASGWQYTDRLRASYALRAVLLVFYAEGPARAEFHALRAAVDATPAAEPEQDRFMDDFPADDRM